MGTFSAIRTGLTPKATCNRRRLLQVGGLGLLNLGLPDLLRASAELPRGQAPKSCILILQQGGPSHLDTWDPKPDAPEDIRGPFSSIATRTPGVRVCELLPRLASLSDRIAILRSMTQPSGDHFAGMHICLSGRSMPPVDAPYFGSIAAKLRPATEIVPSYVWLQNMEYDAGYRYEGGGFLGAGYAPMRVGKYLDNPSAPGFRVRDFDLQPDVSPDRLEKRRGLLHTLAGGIPAELPSLPGAAMERCRERAFDLLTAARTREAFDLNREPDAARDQYGRHPLGQNLLMARRLIEAGVRLVTIHAFTGVAPGEKLVTVNVWDGHGGVDYIGNTFASGTYGLKFMLPRLDQAVSVLLEDLQRRGLLETTLVALLGEFGRTPKISNMGRDHWHHCYSAMLAGGGIRGGLVYGSSDKCGAEVKERPVPPEDFGATLLQALNVPLDVRMGRDGSTFPASPGTSIDELFG